MYTFIALRKADGRVIWSMATPSVKTTKKLGIPPRPPANRLSRTTVSPFPVLVDSPGKAMPSMTLSISYLE